MSAKPKKTTTTKSVWSINGFPRFLRNRFVAKAKMHDISVSRAMAVLMKQRTLLESLFNKLIYEDGEFGKSGGAQKGAGQNDNPQTPTT